MWRCLTHPAMRGSPRPTAKYRQGAFFRRTPGLNKLDFDLQTHRGKGAHYRLKVDGKITTLQSGELAPFHVERICQQLGIDPAAI
jgi:hypothetical protein